MRATKAEKDNGGIVLATKTLLAKTKKSIPAKLKGNVRRGIAKVKAKTKEVVASIKGKISKVGQNMIQGAVDAAVKGAVKGALEGGLEEANIVFAAKTRKSKRLAKLNAAEEE